MEYLYPKIKKRVKSEVAYREDVLFRYSLPYCLALLYIEKPINLAKVLKNRIRKSDKIIRIDKNYYAIFFFVKKEYNLDTLETKVFSIIQESLKDNKVYMGMSCKMEVDAEDVVTMALQNLLLAMQKRRDIVDEF